MTTLAPPATGSAAITVVDPAAIGGAGPDGRPLRVLLVTEGCYPFAWGGVSTWCDALLRQLPDVSFHVMAVVAEPGMEPVFEAPPNLVETIAVPLWNLRDVKEASGVGAGELHRARRRVDDDAVERGFVPPLRRFLRTILDPGVELGRLAADIHELHRFLQEHDLLEALNHPAVWEGFVQEARTGYEAATAGMDRPVLRLWEVTAGFQWLTRWLFPIARPIPEVDVVHLAMAGVCSMVGVAAKLEHDAGYLLTEHGVYLRERYLAEASRRDSLFLKVLALGFARRMTQVGYRLADQISPCCDYNQRWEVEAGADPEALQTIYYGLDDAAFAASPPPQGPAPSVVWVGRINPLKDVETLLRTAAHVLRERPDVRFRLFGGAQAEDAEYHRRCLDLHDDLRLGDAVEFCGYTDQPADAYRGGDVVVLSSVSEGFPFSVLEAMLCGRPVVATAVGGIPEQIAHAGIAVQPRSPEAMAEGILHLLNNPGVARTMGVAARERASTEFTSDRFGGSHRASYLRLSPRHDHDPGAGTSRFGVGLPDPGVPDEVREELVRELADDVAERTWQAVDHLEVAAIIESAGVTDAVASARYGYPDAFRLAEAVLDELRRDPRPRPPRLAVAEPSAREGDGRRPRLDTAGIPALALLPTVGLLAAIWAFSRFTDWVPARVLALSLGFTTGMICTNGIALALTQRGSSLLSLHKAAAARRYLALGLLAALGCTAAVAAVVAAPRWGGDLGFIAENRSTFLLSALALSVVWTLATALSLVSASGWTGVGLVCGVGVGVAVDAVVAPVTSAHVAVATAAGLATTVGLMLLGIRGGLALRLGSRRSTDTTLPSAGYMVLEALPYAAYGTAAMVAFFSIHLVGWIDLGYSAPQVVTLELGLLIALVPVVLGLGPAERGMRGFWDATRALQVTVPAAVPAAFGAALGRVVRANARRYLTVLGVASLATLAATELAIRTGLVARIASGVRAGDLRIVVVTGLAAFAVFGWAQFAGQYCLSLRDWRSPLRAVCAGALVTAAAAVAVVETLGWRWLALALLAGAAVYGTGALRAARRAVAHADHHFVTVV